MLEGLAQMFQNYDLGYMVGCELRHMLASFCLVGVPLSVSYLTLTTRSGAPGRSIFPSWWWFGSLLVVGLALGSTLHFCIDENMLPWLFPPGWA
jgi:hypothetical protein